MALRRKGGEEDLPLRERCRGAAWLRALAGCLMPLAVEGCTASRLFRHEPVLTLPYAVPVVLLKPLRC